MHILKTFQAYACTQDGEPIASLGAVIFPVLNFIRVLPSYTVDLDTNWSASAKTVFEDRVEDPGYIGNAVSTYIGSGPDREGRFSELLKLAPLSQSRNTMEYTGSYILLGGNKSGYYAISHDPINSQGYVGTYDLYDPDGTLMGSVGAANFGFPFADSIGIHNCVATLTNNKSIPEDADLYQLSVNNPYTVNRWSVAVWTFSSSQTLRDQFIAWYNRTSRESTGGDPYSPGGGITPGPGDSTTGGGGIDPNVGNYDTNSDPNVVPNLPTVSAVDTGFITLFTPTVAELKSLANYMWSGLFDVATFKKIMANPMDCILGLSIVPVDVPSAGSDVVKVGNISTGVSMTKAASQYVELDCGTISVVEYWKGYMDYAPYTRIGIFLPYIGYKELDIDLLQVTTMGVKYHVDVLAGGCVAFITANGRVIAQYSGMCSVSIPISANDFTRTLGLIGGLVASGVAMGVTGGMTAPITAATAAGMADAAEALGDTAKNVMTSKPTVSLSGNMGSSNGLLGTQKPYLILTRPNQCHPTNQNIYTGYPAYITYTLGSLSGFTVVQDIHLDNIPFTDAEHDEILTLLRGGVIL